ncbi:predicted protein [Nematostella vectensis]|uniref:Fibronectin type-III domain-containing protein n=1 Tax=Nematostella vectensis TaxID=45351 RepID=A7S4S8_NEMVE|nr:predicted protein [Nematostella vectensis]|eukprot:XP_001633267.1 predicted protein [Nematostella vectensis]
MTISGTGLFSDEGVDVRVEGKAPSKGPGIISSTTNSSITLELKPIEKGHWHAPEILDYYIELYLENQLIRAVHVPPNDPFINFNDLRIFTNYRVWPYARNVYGNGSKSNFWIRTDSIPPSREPTNLQCRATSSSSLLVSWAGLHDKYYIHGILQGYKVVIQGPDGSRNRSRVCETILVKNFTRLEFYTEYNVTVAAFNEKGDGPSADVMCTTDQDVPSVAPVILEAYNTSSSSIFVRWNNSIPAKEVNGILIGFTINATSLATGNSDIEETDHLISHTTIQFLGAYEVHRVHVSARTIKGDGVSAYIDVRTDEDVPEASPSISFIVVNQTSLQISWTELSQLQLNGVLLGYVIELYDGLNDTLLQANMVSCITSFTFRNLEIFWPYKVAMAAMTIKGPGVFGEKSQMTDESVPVVSPHGITGYNTSATSIKLHWAFNDTDRNVLGVLTGFVVHLKAANLDDEFLESEQTKRVIADPKAREYEVTALGIYTLYRFNMTATTSKGEGVVSLEEVLIRTNGKGPGAAPVTRYTTNSTSISVDWDAIPREKLYGPLLGYKVGLYLVTESVEKANLINLAPNARNATFAGLRIFTRYKVIVYGFNEYGDGIQAAIDIRTDSERPSRPPTYLTCFNTSSTSLNVTWQPLSDSYYEHGDIQGYKVITNQTDGNSSFVIATCSSNRMLQFKDLIKYTEYNVTVEAFNEKGGGPSAEVMCTTDQDVPSAAPVQVEGYNISDTAIRVNWLPVPSANQHGVILGYKIYYSDKITSNRQSSTVDGGDVLTGDIQDLEPYTVYLVRVSAFTIKGQGPSGPLINVKTEERVPSAAPVQLEGYNISDTAIRVNWLPVPSANHHGVILGYKIHYSDNITSNRQSSTVDGGDVLTGDIQDLEPYTVYLVRVSAFTIKGQGPSGPLINVQTEERVPSAPPQLFAGNNISKSAINITWSPVPTDHQNGVILGYLIQYKESSSPESPWDIIQVNDSSAEVWTVDDLWPLTLYTMQVAAFTLKGVGPWTSEIEVTTDEAAPAYPPEDFRGHFASSVAVKLYWTPIPPETLRGALRLYRISYEAQGSLYISKLDVPPDQSEALVTGLNEFTEYRFWIQGVNRFEGNISSEIVIKTDEDVPDSIPSEDVVVRESTERTTDLIVQWEELTDDEKNGDLLGYKVYYKYNSMNSKESRKRRAISGEPLDGYEMVVVPPTQTSVTLSGLKKFSTYSVKVIGFTAKGNANISQDIVVSTPQDAPDGIPADLRVTNKSDPYWIPVWWGRIPIELINGILLGYRLYYKRVVTNGRPVDEPAMNLTFRTTEFSTTLVNLRKDSIYRVQVTAFTKVGEGPRAEVMAETCRCPPVFTTSWYNFPPYVNISETNLDGFLPQILADAIALCCSDCVNGFGTSRVDFLRDSAGNLAKKRNVVALTSSINYTDIAFPVPGYKGQTTYPPYIYVAIAKSPGVAYITVKELPGERGNVVQRMVFSCWPIFMLFLVTVIIAGVLIWVLERSVNPGEFPPSFITGVWNGVWWAFITMTTLG